MSQSSDSPVPPVFIQHHPARQRGLSRRQMVQRMLAGAGAGMAIPAFAATHPIHRHLADAEVWEQADAQSTAGEWQPLFFDPHQNETFIVLAERIVPGSTQANVNRFVDLLLSVDALETQRQFVNSVSAFDGEALARYQRPYKDLTEEQQNGLLTEASTLPPTRKEPAPAWAQQIEKLEEPKEQVVTMRDHFENLKGWISGAYYSSEVGLKDLGWTGQVMWPSFPGCQHPGGHA